MGFMYKLSKREEEKALFIRIKSAKSNGVILEKMCLIVEMLFLLAILIPVW